MIRQIIRIALTINFCLLPLTAQSIREIDLEGSSNFSVSKYLQWINISTGSNYFGGIEDSIKTRISSGLVEEGYFYFKINSVVSSFVDDSQKVDIYVNITEGEPTIIRRIYFENLEKEDSLAVTLRFEYLEGSYFNKFVVEENIEEVLDYYENNGFPFAAVGIESLVFNFDTLENKNYLDLILGINKGPLSLVNKVEITGNTKTKDYVIIRNIRLNEAEPYSQKRIEEIPGILNKLRFFEPVETPSYYFNSKDEGILKITVKEKVTNNFDGIVGYVPGNNDEKGYFTGFVNISLRNLFGTERGVAFRWQQEDRYSQELELKYLEPWFLGFPFNINLGLFQRKQDTSYVQRMLDANIEFLATENISASLLLSSESTIPTESEFSKFTVYNSSIFSTGASVKYDTRDDFYSPTEGIRFVSAYKFSKKTINGPEEYITPNILREINLQRIEFDFAIFYEMFRRQVLALALHGRELRGPFFEVSDLYRLGGTNTLRGYREKQFSGNRILWTNLEYRYLLTQRSFVYLLFDTGYYLRNEDIENNILRLEGFLIGYGLGINIETALGVLGVSYALAKGETFNQGKIHFGLLNEF